MGGETYELSLVAQPDEVPPIIRLRHILKALLRVYGFRCVRVEDVTPYPDGPPAGTPTLTPDGPGGDEATPESS
jgi:hypothetical protein